MDAGPDEHSCRENRTKICQDDAPSPVKTGIT